MLDAVFSSPLFGIALSVLLFSIGSWIQKTTKIGLFTPLISGGFLLVLLLLFTPITYEQYNAGGSLITMLLGPTTACLSINIYRQRALLKEYWLPIIVGCFAGALAAIGSVSIMCRLFGLDAALTNSMLPKSVTSAISFSLCELNNGILAITVIAVTITGNIGAVMAPTLIKLFRIKDPVEAGIAIGTCSHAVGTSRALEIGETEGAMSGLAIGITGLWTVVLSIFFMVS